MKLKWELGTVKFFDYWTGQGLIRSNDGEYYQVHYSTIESEKKWKTLKKNKNVKFTSIKIAGQYLVTKIKEL